MRLITIGGGFLGAAVKLAGKLIFIVVVGIVLIVAIEAYLSINRDMAVFHEELELDTKQLGHTLAVLVEDVWRQRGEDRALKLIEMADEAEPLVNVRWVWLDAKEGERFVPIVSMERLQDIAPGNRKVFSERNAAGKAIFCFYELVDVASPRRGALELSLPATAFDSFRRDTIISASLVSGGVVVISAVLTVMLGIFLIGRPLERLIVKTRRIGEGDLSGPLAIHSRDEFSELGRAINEMCDHLAIAREKLHAETEARLAAIAQLEHANRLATVGRLAAGLAHELGTPMNVVSARAASIVEESPVEELSAHAKVIRAQIDRMTELIRQLLAFARRHSPRKGRVDLTALVGQTVELLASLSRKRNAAIRIESGADHFFVQADSGQIQQVFTNLITNAIDAMPTGGEIQITLRSVMARPPGSNTSPPTDRVQIDVTDHGTGIAPDNLQRIFDPFFTTKEVGKGTGLGLSIAYGIVLEHGGWIDVSSRLHQGSRFSVLLPRPTGTDAVPTEETLVGDEIK